ncbi:hypothetical protein BH24ACI3_BH24ACI3_08420 [soil metagenome]
MEVVPKIPQPEMVPCPDDFGAYLDGDLLPNEESNFEAHLADCAACRTELNQQKVFLSMLDGALDNDLPQVDPVKLTRSIIVSAESSVSGLRSPKEQITAAFICLAVMAIAAGAIAIIGGGISTEVNSPFDRSVGIAAAAGHLVYNVSLSLSVIIRSVTSDLTVVRTLWAVVFFVGMLGIAYRIRRPIMQLLSRNS